jgi:hypothetical protein
MGLRSATPDDGKIVTRGQGVAGSNPAVPTGVMSQDIEDTPNPRQGSGACLRAGFRVWVGAAGVWAGSRGRGGASLPSTISSRPWTTTTPTQAKPFSWTASAAAYATNPARLYHRRSEPLKLPMFAWVSEANTDKEELRAELATGTCLSEFDRFGLGRAYN